ncbi:hypothetical protein SSX86_029567 [Deinandra increscens subsp. villosa]|uniref:Uncharacterized protein n=1 Tax=Deinandra increscens subsp. villosa TaxID=3103831 RepID=A0AAP0CF23_9ASTR
MTNNSPIFTLHEPQHFSDYGFDPQIDYFQVLEEARKHKRETTFCSSRSAIDSLHFKLQKPISKEYENSKKIKKTRKRWWKNALHFFKRKRSNNSSSSSEVLTNNPHFVYGGAGVRTFSGPMYLAESSFSGCSTPNYHRSSASSRPPSGTVTPAGKGDLDIPYVSLTELNMEQSHKISAGSSVMPIYLVT